MMKFVDNILNRTTMYRLLLYVLGAYLAIGMMLSFAGKLPYNGWMVLLSTTIVLFGCWFSNLVMAWAYDAPRHNPSAYITALILALIISPIRTVGDLPLYFWAPILAMAGKYILASGKQHLFNPAAFAVALTAIAINGSATWWVGNVWMLPAVAIGGFLIVRKIRRWDVVGAFLGMAAISVTVLALFRHTPILNTWKVLILDAPLVFFATVMLTEPFTMPPTHRYRLFYGATIGLLFAPQLHIGSLYSTPELALVIGNFIFWLIASRDRYVLKLIQRVQLSDTTYDFIFSSDRPIRFRAGQYLEWALPHASSDQRGSRRYFTIASAPTESTIRMGVKFYPQSSSYKQTLRKLHPGQTIVAGQLDGDFTLPKDVHQKLVFLAGGIGVTPFRSMIQQLINTQEQRDVVLLFANQRPSDIVYQDIFDQASQHNGVRVVHVIADEASLPPMWGGERGYVTAEMIQRQVPDYAERLFYISGPQGMVQAYKKTLRSLGVPNQHIKTDYFPGFS